MATRPKRPRDVNQLAALIVGISTGEIQDADPNAGKDPAAVALGRKGGLKGGKTIAKRLGSKGLAELGQKGATARWAKQKTTTQPEGVSASDRSRRRKKRHVIEVQED